MKFRNLVTSAVLLVSLSFSSLASAELYVLGGGGIMAHEFTNVSNPSAFKMGVGYMTPSNIGFEASYMNLGGGAIGGGGTLSMNGTNFSGVLELPLQPLVMSFKAGLYSINASALGSSATSSGFSLGFMFGYEASDRMMIFMDTEGFVNVDATAGNYESPTLITFGIRYRL